MTTKTERPIGMRDFKVHGDNSPVFRDQAKRWYDGDTIQEEDLLRLFTAKHIEMLLEGEALEVLGAEVPAEEAQGGSEDSTGEPQEPEGTPEATGDQSLPEANAEVSGDPPAAAEASKGKSTKGK